MSNPTRAPGGPTDAGTIVQIETVGPDTMIADLGEDGTVVGYDERQADTVPWAGPGSLSQPQQGLIGCTKRVLSLGETCGIWEVVDEKSWSTPADVAFSVGLYNGAKVT